MLVGPNDGISSLVRRDTDSMAMNLNKLWETVKNREAWRAAVQRAELELGTEGTPGNLLSLLLHHLKAQQDGSRLQAGKRGLGRTRPCQHPDLRPSASRTVRNTFLLFQPHAPALRLQCVVTAAQRDQYHGLSLFSIFFLFFCTSSFVDFTIFTF